MTIKLSKSLVDLIKTRWLDIWHSKLTDGADAHVAMWVEAVTDVLSKSGYDLLTPELLAAEKSISAAGLEHEYFDALMSLTHATPDNPMALMAATSSERMKAIDMVRAHKETTKQENGSH